MIPKVFYMCDKTLDNIKIYSKNWTNLNPDYEMKLYDNPMCEKFLLNEYSQSYCNIFRGIPDGPIKADFWRVCILYKYGGVYVDADNEPLVPLSAYIDESADFVTCSSYWDEMKFKFNPNFIMAKAGDQILKDSIDMYVRWFNNKFPYEYWKWSIMNVFTKVIHLNNYNCQDGIYYMGDKKVQIIKEVKGHHMYNDHNIYNSMRVFNNRYQNWNADTHQFNPTVTNKWKNKHKNQQKQKNIHHHKSTIVNQMATSTASNPKIIHKKTLAKAATRFGQIKKMLI